MEQPLLMAPHEEARGTASGDSDAGAGAPPALRLRPPGPPSLEDVVDDFSLQSPGIRFRAGREMKIYEQAGGGQLILEETTAADDAHRGRQGHGGLLVRSTDDTDYAHGFLRAAYSLMAIFVGGFIFIVGFDILLFLFIDVGKQMGVTSEGDFQLVPLFAVCCSVPVFVYSLAMGMTLVGKLVIDTFYGNPFLRSFGLGVVTTDWLAFTMYLGIPILALITTLFRELENWWEISLLTWFISILVFWGFFSACVIYLEVWACLLLVEEDDQSSLGEGDPRGLRLRYWGRKAGKACARTMGYRLSGKRTHFKKMDDRKRTSIPSRVLPSQSPYSWIANQEWNPCFDQKPPKQIHTMGETLGNTYYVTSQSWSLEKLFCRVGGIRSAIPITQGESSITEAQINSNIACNLLGNLVIAMLFIGTTVWFDLPPVAHWMASILALTFFVWVGFATRRMCRLRKDVVKHESAAAATLYRYYEVFQHAIPKDGFILAVISLQVLFLYVVPLVYLALENRPLAVVFAFLGLFSALRHYINPCIMLLEHGRKDYFRNLLQTKTKKERMEWKKKARLYHIVAVGGDNARHFWTAAYIVCVMFFVGMVLMAANESEGDPSASAQSSMTLVEGYTYQPNPHLPYPTCQLKFGGINLKLADFAFLSGVAYHTDDFASSALKKWFGDDEVINNSDLIKKFNEASDCEDHSCNNPVDYKLITFPDGNAVLTIRGTATTWDVIADAQLWISAMLFQGLRFLLPLSDLFTPILVHMVTFVNLIQSESIAKVAYYHETVSFVNYLKDVEGFKELEVTGHSLGGGIAIITGAQSGTSAIALSGPNAMLSRNSFLPAVTEESLNTFTFNVVPDSDPIPRFDDKARLYQRIRCTATAQNFAGCHAITRSLCEIQYTCGSINPDRPVPCECVFDYGYPEPSLPTMNQTTSKPFIQTCIDSCGEADGTSEETCERWKVRSIQ